MCLTALWARVRAQASSSKQQAIERKIMKVSPMSDEFHDWLESCPVQWFRGEVTKDHVAYYFETPNEEEE